MNKEQPKRLGRGLAALMGDAAVPSTVAAPGVQSLAVDLLEPSPFQPRRKMDEGALAELSASIGQRGILQPLLVRPHPAAEGRYQIIAGERRWRAAQQVPLHEVPVLVRRLSDTDAMAAGLVENLQREDLNPVEEAEGYDRLLNEFQMTQEMLGEAIGKSRAHIGNMLRLLKLPNSVLEMVRTGELSFGHARAIMSHISPLTAAREVIKKGLTVRQTEKYLETAGRSINPKILTKPPPERRYYDADLEAVQQQLIDRLGLDVTVTFGGKKGTVMIKYESLDQLDTLLALLNG
jgi:ParB family chromosome partitioning protein